MKKIFLFVLICSVCVTGVFAQGQIDEDWEKALDAWDKGEYIDALKDFKGILTGTKSDLYFKDIALITGELFKVTEISKDGTSPNFSPGGRYVTYETEENGVTVTHIIDTGAGNKEAAKINGTNVRFSPDESKVLFLQVQETDEVLKKRAELSEVMEKTPGDRRAVFGKRREVGWAEALNTKIIVRDMRSGKDTILQDNGLLKVSPQFNFDGSGVFFTGGEVDVRDKNDIYSVDLSSNTLRPVTSGEGFKSDPVSVKGGKYLLYSIPSRSPLPRAASAGFSRFRRSAPAREFVIVDLSSGIETKFSGSNPSVSADGSTLIYTVNSDSLNEINTLKLDGTMTEHTVKKTTGRIVSAGISPGGQSIVYSMMNGVNYDVYTVKSDSTAEVNISDEIQHDRYPRYLTDKKILYIKGEGRHSRSYIYDMLSGETTKLFHNNTIRTIAPEYGWAVNAAGTKVLIQADRDGDTISPEQGIYIVDLIRKIGKDELLARIDKNLKDEQALRAKGERIFKPIFEKVSEAVKKVSIRKIYEYEEVLYNFGSKYITEPGNKPAGEYIFNTLRSFGYEPEYQYFESRNVRSANVLATLPGTENPELVYVLSSHYDSNRRSPGADDNTSSVAILLETARILKNTPMPATIIFAAFSGEEAGLLGSRHFVAEAVKNKINIAGALNNDMIGWANDHRLDNTIRYSNVGICDIQHAGAFLFSKMITYDAHYYRGTDAAAYYDAFGDIVGGIGSYPVLGSPHYHQVTDVLETINHQLLYEAAKANTAALMLIASSPARIKELKVDKVSDNELGVSWQQSPEKNIKHYSVTYGTEEKSEKKILTTKSPNIKIKIDKNLKGKMLKIGVKAYKSNGLEGWDWAWGLIKSQ
ncbi:M20/M25/M40 family metallo-hydrolase [candidate division KSB1 bacterium]